MDTPLTLDKLKNIIQSSHINFLFGAGLSRPYLTTLGDIETWLTDCATIENERERQITEDNLKITYVEGVMKPCLDDISMDEKRKEDLQEVLEKDEDFISWITKFLYVQLIDDVLSNRAQNEHVAPAINKLKSLSKEFSKVFSIPTDKETPSLWEEGKPLAVINMSKVSVSMKKLIPLLLSYKYYQEHKNKKSDVVTSSLNIIIDEAHNILSYDSTRESQEWKDFRLETFEEIIKEGRKFGVFLTIASQRPSDISATIISQLHNYLIHRLINNRDLEMVEKAIAYLDKISIESLPILPAGACVLSGIMADLPLILQVDPLSKEEQPESQTIDLTKSWLDKSTEEGEQTTEEEGEPTMEDKDHTMAEEDLTTADASSGDLDDRPF